MRQHGQTVGVGGIHPAVPEPLLQLFPVLRTLPELAGQAEALHYTFAEATWSQSLPDWLASHVRMLTYFGGCTELLVPDNLKSGVSKACRYDPDINLSRLLLELTQAKADGSYSKLLKLIARTGVPLIDDWRLETLNTAQRNGLMESMDDRHGSTSTVMISQLPTDQWYAAIGANTLADTILDRLMHNAHRLPLKGESIRKMLNQLTER